MDWTQFLGMLGALFIANLGVILPLFIWLRTESSADRREIINLITEIKKEMTDFHGRLCTLEERYLQIITGKRENKDTP